MRDLFPARARDGAGPLDATVFKIERGRASAVRVYEHGATPLEGTALAGDVARVWGLKDVHIGDQLGSPERLPAQGFFAPPSVELYTALERLSEQDPFIGIRRRGHEVSVRLYGEVQKEVVRSTLAEEFGVDVRFEESRTLYVERLSGTGASVQHPAPDERVYFWATAGDFRGMTQLVLREVVRRAGTRVHEPVNTFEAEVPTAAVSAVLRKLVELRAVPGEPVARGSVCTVDGTIPAASVHELEQALPALTQGEGVFFSEFGGYRPR
ncbi:hypothetical protein [Amycolatopsis saalfeldensis]|uniref:Elongation factor G C-terminus n=1 Tax=Amycolatopsis saalfeldensis TaxID=394193 RepID=A0A1H8YMV7_9PSEU|nr:Elongation factor G C-terminus [Amycolatopsis saalfeldensis]